VSTVNRGSMTVVFAPMSAANRELLRNSLSGPIA
jgi:hypothetical protein